jgi:hypothetical protein
MVTVGTNWKCPYCAHAQVITDDRYGEGNYRFHVSGWKYGRPVLAFEVIVCANDQCKEVILDVTLGTYIYRGNQIEFGGPGKSWSLLPASSAKPQPDYIPEPIRNDYNEACAIRDLSPKASATITRRCLQGMIRHFCGISKSRLIDEINELRDRVHEGKAPVGVQPDSVDAIDHVRQIGNIGAHMEADINAIVDVDPNEAQLLIELVEVLFAEWYVASEARKQNFAKLRMVAADKKKQKHEPQPPT